MFSRPPRAVHDNAVESLKPSSPARLRGDLTVPNGHIKQGDLFAVSGCSCAVTPIRRELVYEEPCEQESECPE